MSRYELMKLSPEKPRLLDRILRSITLGPFNSKDKVLASLFGGGPTTSGVAVSSSNVLTYSAVWSAVTMVSDDIGSLPLHLYRNTDTASGKGKERFRDHPLYELLHDTPNPEMDAMTLIKTMQGHRMIYQNAYAEIVRDGAGRPREIWPLVPERVSVERDRSGRLTYRVANPNGGDVFIGPEDMIHLVGQSHDGMKGCELVDRARESFALGLAAEKFGGAFFGNGATMSGVISYPTAKPVDKVVKNTQEAIDARHQGVDRAHKLLALYNGAKYERMGVNPNEGQFNETRIFQIREVARWFKIPPHKLGDLADATYSNVEQMQAAYLESCIRPYLKEWQQQLSRKLISRLERRQQFFEFDTHGFMSVDATSRAELYQAESHVGSVTINEIRSYENRNPVEGGDVPFVQLQSIPLDLARPYWEASIKGMLAKAEKDQRPEPTPQPPPQDDEADRKLIEFVERVHPALTKEIADLREAVEQEKAARRVAVQQAEDLSAAREELEQQRDEARAKLSQAIEWLDGAKVALAESQAERVRERAEYEAKQEDDARAFLGAKAELAAQEAKFGSELDVERGNVRHARERADAAESARLQAIDNLADLAGENESLRAGLNGALAQAEETGKAAAAQVLSLTQERDAEKSRADAAVVELGTERERCTEALGQTGVYRTLATERDAECIGAQQRAVAAEQRAEAAERDKAIAEQTAQAANELVESRRQAEAKRMLDVIASHRALMADAMGRLVRREIANAKSYQATPQKLRTWLNSYYDETESALFAEALMPSVAVHLAWMQSSRDVEHVVSDLVTAHFEESKRILSGIVDTGSDGYKEVLQRTLRQWESTRASKFADTLMAEEIAHVSKA